MEIKGFNNLPVLVIGATGFLGMEICKQLIEKNKKVRGLIRSTSDVAKVQALEKMGVETVVGDIKDSSSLNNACKEVGAVITTVSSTLSRQEGDSIESVDNKGQKNVVDAAAAAGVKKFIYISFNKMPYECPLQLAKRNVEKHLTESGVPFTILQPTFFMEVWLGPHLGFDYANAKASIYGEGKNKITWIAIKDVAAFAVNALDNEALINKTIELGGPQPLSPLEVITIFEEQGAGKFQVTNVPEDALTAQKNSATDPLNESFAALMLSYAKGNEIDMKNIFSICNIQLTSIKDYAKSVVPVKVAL
ncbi:MAG: SDR family oxidoreductase [Ginsengibacter sp.]